MRIALISDIHGNSFALDAVLSDCRGKHIDEIWVLGDVVALGPDPEGVIERLVDLPSTYFIQGNMDWYIIGNYHGLPPQIHWTKERVEKKNARFWLESFSLEKRILLPDGTRMLGVHVAPGRYDGEGISPATSEEILEQMLAECYADLVFAAHTHVPMNIHSDSIHVVTLGSVSNQFKGYKNASYIILTANKEGYRVTHRSVPYDREKVIEMIEKSTFPDKEKLIRFMKGEAIAVWQRNLEKNEKHVSKK